jgi:GDP-4-dehydro-6-deoxy-D-mannose reductase
VRPWTGCGSASSYSTRADGIRAFVTGASGFAGRHLVRHLTDVGATVVAPPRPEVDLLDAAAVRRALADARPDRVFHLGALASVGRSWQDSRATLVSNIEMTLNVLEAVRAEAPGAWVLHAGSGEVYGRPERLPVDEDAALRPQNPYATSKAASDLLAGQYADTHALHVVRTRAFNHAGPGQSDEYVLGTLTRQVAEAEAGGAHEVVLRTGNPDARRDFTDVRDVVRAYAAAAALDPGVYNVASGRTASVRELIELLASATDVRLEHEVDPERIRPSDVPEVRGSAERLHEATGWTPQLPLSRTVADALDEWRVQLQ